MTVLDLGILISGRGSNMEAILSSIINDKSSQVTPQIVISDNAEAQGLRIAAEMFGVPVLAIPGRGLRGWEYDSKLAAALEQHGVTPAKGLVCLAGFMRLLGPEFVRRYSARIMNIHPALLPAFPGLHAQRQAIEYGAKVSGCSVHFVDEGTDTGPVILQRAVQVLESDTEESLASRILYAEHELYPLAVRLFAEGRLSVEGRRVRILGQSQTGA